MPLSGEVDARGQQRCTALRSTHLWHIAAQLAEIPSGEVHGDMLSHRDRDDSGTLVDQAVSFGHKPLSIIDPSVLGIGPRRQPWTLRCSLPRQVHDRQRRDHRRGAPASDGGRVVRAIERWVQVRLSFAMLAASVRDQLRRPVARQPGLESSGLMGGRISRRRPPTVGQARSSS